MRNVDISCVADCDSCEKVKRFFCEFRCAECADNISFEFPVNVSMKFLAERMVLFIIIFSSHENYLSGTDEKDMVEFKRKSHWLLGLSIIDIDSDEEIAGYYKVFPDEGRFEVERWITDYCATDILKKGYISSDKQKDRLKYRLVAMAY